MESYGRQPSSVEDGTLNEWINYWAEAEPFQSYMFNHDVLATVTPLARWKSQAGRISDKMMKVIVQLLGAKVLMQLLGCQSVNANTMEWICMQILRNIVNGSKSNNYDLVGILSASGNHLTTSCKALAHYACMRLCSTIVDLIQRQWL